MEKMRLGKTNLTVSRTGFGALPIQRTQMDEAVRILRRAYDAGIDYFDTARGYSDSEEKLGSALSSVRQNIVIATKTPAQNAKGFWEDLETSLRMLKTDYIDVYQFHNPSFIPLPGGTDGLYDAAVEAKQKGLIRHIAITNHAFDKAKVAVASGLYDLLQFPFSVLSSKDDIDLVNLCEEYDVGFVAMKALSGGLITNAVPTFSFIRQQGNVLPIWGIQQMHELEEFIALSNNPPKMDEEMQALIAADIQALAGDFCRGCGYCLPCPTEIPINTAARIYFLVTRSPSERFRQPDFAEQMDRIDACIECGLCASRCPYGLDTPNLLKRQLELYRNWLQTEA